MTSAGIVALVDTNVLAYAYDGDEPAKQPRAVQVLERLERRSAGAVSTQVLGEFYDVATRKIATPLSPEEAEWNVAAFARGWTVYGVTLTAVLEAIRATRHHQLRYWDGLIWATAKLNGVRTVLSEDFSDGQLLEGVLFLNPFSQPFDPASLT